MFNPRKLSLKDTPPPDNNGDDLDRMLKEFQQQRAAKTLQRQWRGYQGKKQQQAIQEEELKRNGAAVTLQKNWRRHRDRVSARTKDVFLSFILARPLQCRWSFQITIEPLLLDGCLVTSNSKLHAIHTSLTDTYLCCRLLALFLSCPRWEGFYYNWVISRVPMSFSLLEFRAWRYCNDAAVCFSKIRSGTTRLRLVLPLEFRIFLGVFFSRRG